jgi:hypothetical protein
MELVGEFFEVRTQVDRDLTTVSQVDRWLGLIKNLGRHRTPVQYSYAHGTAAAQVPLEQMSYVISARSVRAIWFLGSVRATANCDGDDSRLSATTTLLR